MMNENEIISITKNAQGRQQIVFKKSILKGVVSSKEVQNAVLIAARMQSEKLIEKLSRGAPLDKDEVKMLRDIAEIAKIASGAVDTAIQQNFLTCDVTQAEQVKDAFHAALQAKLSQKS